MTCDRCETLAEEVAYLKAELGLIAAGDELQALRDVMRASGSQGRNSPASVVLALYRAHGRTVSKFRLMTAIPPHDGRHEDDRDDKIVAVWLCRARKGLGPDMIENVWGKGYRLTPAGMARVAEILAQTAVAS